MGLLLGLISNVLGGASYLLQKLALEGWPPASLVLGRTLIALPLLWVVTPRGWARHATRADWARMVIIAAFGYAAPHLVGIHGLRDTGSLNGALLIGMEPITIVILSWALLSERLRKRQVLGILAAVVGAGMVVSRGDWRSLLAFDPSTRGNVLLLIHGALWAIYTVAAKPTLARVPPIALTTVVATISAALMLPPALMELAAGADTSRLFDPVPLACTVTLGVLITAGASVLWNVSLSKITPTQMAGLIFVQPLVGSALGVFAGEPLGPAAVAGGALVLAGVWLSQETPEAEPPAAPA